MTTMVTPWWQALRLRDELLDQSGAIGDVQMSLRGVAYGVGGQYPPYRDIGYFGEITHPSPSLVRIAADLAVRLGGQGGQAGSAKTVWRFDQGMGGGKSHALVLFGTWAPIRRPSPPPRSVERFSTRQGISSARGR